MKHNLKETKKGYIMIVTVVVCAAISLLVMSTIGIIYRYKEKERQVINTELRQDVFVGAEDETLEQYGNIHNGGGE